MKNSKESPTIKCGYCGDEIPVSAALTPEGMDYTMHFCGKACYEDWQKNHNEQQQK